MDERLKKAISKGEEERQSEYRKEQARKQEEMRKHDEHLASFAKQADDWVNEHLFDLIAEAEKEGRKQIMMPSALGIPNAALRTAVKKIQGIRVWSEMVNYCDDYGREEEWFISWSVPQPEGINLQMLYPHYRGQ